MKNKRYLKLISVVSIPLFVFVIVFIFLISYSGHYLKNEFQKNSIEAQKAYLSQIKKDIDEEFRSIQTMNMQLLEIDSVKKLQNIQKVTYFQDVLQLSYDLKNFNFSSPSVYGYYILFKNTNLIYHDNAISTLKNYFNINYSIKDYTQEEPLSLVFEKSSMMKNLNPIDISFLNGKYEPCIPIVTTLNNGPNHIQGAIVTLVKLCYFQSIVQGYQDVKNSQLKIVNKNNEILFTSNDDFLTENSNKIFSLQTDSDIMDWSYILEQPESTIFKKTLVFQKILIVIIFILIVFSFFLVFLFSLLPSNPIKRLLFSNTTLQVTNNILQENINRQKENLRKVFLERWITGVFCTTHEMELYSPYLYQEYQGKLFAVLLISIDSDLFFDLNDNKKSISNSYQNEKECIINLLCEKLSFCTNNFHDYEVNKLVYVITNSELTEKEFLEWLTIKKQNTEEIIQSCDWKNTHVSIGSIQHKMENIAKSLSCALDNLSSENEVFDFAQANHRVSNISFTSDMRIQLSQMVLSGNIESVTKFLQSLLDNNIQKINRSDTLLKAFAYALWGTLLNIVGKLPNLSEEIKQPIVLDYMNLKQFSDPDKIKNSFNGFYKITQFCNESKENNRNKLAENIKKYVKENYSDNNLCLQSLADEFELSFPYVSQIFKNTFKENFIDYLQEIRIKKAQELLVTTDLQIKEIFEQCGYSSNNTFGRVFRKKCGISAVEYRRQNKKNQNKTSFL